MKKNLLLGLLALLPLFVFAQSDYKQGYVITLEGDTLFGQINVKSNITNAKTCGFIQIDTEEEKNYTPSQIKAYCIPGFKLYSAKYIKVEEMQQTVFLECLVDGFCNLYFHQTSTQEYFFIEKEDRVVALTNNEISTTNDDGSTVVRETNKYKGVLKYYFQDAPSVQSKVNNTPFTYKPLVRLVKEYNEVVCTDGTVCIDYTKKIKSEKTLELYAGYHLGQLTLQTSSQGVSSGGAVFGFNYIFSPIKAHYIWEMLIGFGISTATYDADIYDYNTAHIEDVHVQSSVVSAFVPVKFRYNFPSKKIQPYLTGGVNTCISFSGGGSTLSYKRVNGATRVVEEEFYAGAIGFLPVGGVGAKYYLNENYLSFEFNYQLQVGYYDRISKTNSMFFVLAYGF